MVIMIGVAFAATYGWPTHMTWWSLIVAFLIAGIWLVPIGMVQATTNVSTKPFHVELFNLFVYSSDGTNACFVITRCPSV